MKDRGLTNEALASKLHSPRTGGTIDPTHVSRLRRGLGKTGPGLMEELARVFGPDDGAALRQALAEDKTPPSVRAALVEARARAEASISEADKLYFPTTFKASHKEAARKLVAAIFSALDADPAWLAPAVARFEGAAFAALDATNARLGGSGGGSATPPLQARAQGA